MMILGERGHFSGDVRKIGIRGSWRTVAAGTPCISRTSELPSGEFSRAMVRRSGKTCLGFLGWKNRFYSFLLLDYSFCTCFSRKTGMVTVVLEKKIQKEEVHVRSIARRVTREETSFLSQTIFFAYYFLFFLPKSPVAAFFKFFYSHFSSCFCFF